MGDEGVEVCMVICVRIEKTEDEGRNKLYQELFLAHGPPSGPVPLGAGLIADEATDEEEQGHAERHEKAVDEGGGAKAETGHLYMRKYDEDHGHPTQCVNVFYPLAWLLCAC